MDNQYYQKNKKRYLSNATAYYHANRDKMRALQFARKREKKGDFVPIQMYEKIRQDGINDYSSIIAMIGKPKRSSIEPDIEQSIMTPEQKWFDDIRVNILKGISTLTLSEEDHQKWWSNIEKRVNAKMILDKEDYSDTHYSRNNAGKYIGALEEGIYRGGGKTDTTIEDDI